jgi:hypothetical protein
MEDGVELVTRFNVADDTPGWLKLTVPPTPTYRNLKWLAKNAICRSVMHPKICIRVNPKRWT